ncbi:hypothetical protein FACS1894180_6790 [Bacteroidia bacterium]|nr:hypothetical protein FACS1894180_6790 [Bacteroidia bacterium]
MMLIATVLLIGAGNMKAQTWNFSDVGSPITADVTEASPVTFTSGSVAMTVKGALTLSTVNLTLSGTTYTKALYAGGTSNSSTTKIPTRRYFSIPVTEAGTLTVIAAGRNTNSNTYDVMLVTGPSSTINNVGSVTTSSTSIRSDDFAISDAGTVYIHHIATKDVYFLSIIFTPAATGTPAITAFSFTGDNGEVYNAVVNEGTHTITGKLPVAMLATEQLPNVSINNIATSYSPTIAQDFSNSVTSPVIYTTTDGTTPVQYQVKISALNDDATLSKLLINGVYVDLLDGVYAYTVKLNSARVGNPTISATKNDESATVETPTFSEYGTTATIEVTAEDGSVQTYTITIADLPEDMTCWNFSDTDDFPSGSYSAETVTEGLTIAQGVSVDATSAKNIDSYAFTGRLKFGGNGTLTDGNMTGRYISFDLPTGKLSVTLVVYGYSSSASNARSTIVSDGTTTLGTLNDNVDAGSTPKRAVIEFTRETSDPRTVYLYTTDGGFNLFGLCYKAEEIPVAGNVYAKANMAQNLGSFYLGDPLQPTNFPNGNYWFNFQIRQQSWNMAKAGIGQNTDGTTGWTEYTVNGIDGYEDGTSNVYVHGDLGNFQFTSTGTYYAIGKVKAADEDPYTYGYAEWGNSTVFNAANASYFTVNALTAPTGNVDNPTGSQTQLRVTCTEWLGREMMIVRYPAGAPATAPSNGTSYSAGAALGAGKVLFCGFGEGNTEADSKTITDDGESGDPLTAGTSYDYYFYSVNYNYYSAGEKRSATTASLPLTFTASERGKWLQVSAPLELVSANDFSFGYPRVAIKTLNANGSWTTVTGTNFGITYFAAGDGFLYMVNSTDPTTYWNDGKINFDLTEFTLATSPVSKSIAAGHNFCFTGNPFDVPISFTSLASANSSFKPEGYYEWNGSSFDLKTDDISVWKGIVVENLETQPSGTISFVKDDLQVSGSGAPALVGNTNAQITIEAINANGTGTAYIKNNANGSATVGNYDMSFLNMGENEAVQVYTSKTDNSGNARQLALNTVNTDNAQIPVGVFTTYAGAVTLTLTGMNSYDCSVALLDNLTATSTDLTGLSTYSYETSINGSTDSRFALVFSPRVPTDISANETVNTQAFVSNGKINIVSTDALQQVRVFSVSGAQIFNSAVNGTSYTVNSQLPAGAYLVEVSTNKSVTTQKVVLK